MKISHPSPESHLWQNNYTFRSFLKDFIVPLSPWHTEFRYISQNFVKDYGGGSLWLLLDCCENLLVFHICFFFSFYYYFFLPYNIVLLVLPYINMHLPRVYRCSPSWTSLPPPSPYHPSGSSQCTSPKLMPGHPSFILHTCLLAHEIFPVTHLIM